MHRLASAAFSGVLILISSGVVEARGGRISGGLVAVSGHTKRDGTVVAPYLRTAPDGRLDNNLSYRGKSPLRGAIPQATDTPPPGVSASLKTASADAAPEVILPAVEAVTAPKEPGVHWHHVACPNEKMVGGTDPYNTFCQIN